MPVLPTFLLLAALGAEAAGQSIKRVEGWSAVPFTDVVISDTFWSPRQKTNREVSLKHSLQMEESEGIVNNFRLAAAKKTEGYRGLIFSDSDLYKVIESCSFSLATHFDPDLDKKLDELIAIIGSAQLPDGYMNTYYQVKEPGKRLTNLRDAHEIYCAGHLFEAAVAHQAATKKTSLLRIAERYADFLCDTFGPGKRMGYCGHPEAELALVKLWRATGKRKYFELAEFMTLSRGSKFFAQEHRTPVDKYDGTYWQDDVSIYDHERVKGHAVRHGYLLSAATEIGAETKNGKLLAMVDRVWKNLTERNLYVTGGMGSSASNEGFTKDFDLPNASAYQETCASVAVAMLAHRMNLAYGDARYADVMETALYNGVLAGVSLDGKKFFYVNPLASEGKHHRSDWFGCACCPPNVTRTLAALGNYAYASTPNGVAVNLYIEGSVQTAVHNERFEFKVKSKYPWEGSSTYTIVWASKKAADFKFRIPSWASGASIRVNGVSVSASTTRGYATVSRAFRTGDRIEVDLPMPVRRITANPRVVENIGKFALARGPIVYCLETFDNKFDLDEVSIPANESFATPNFLFNGIPLVACEGSGLVRSIDWTGGLYGPPPMKQVKLRFVPYAFWDNRSAGQMRVWVPFSPAAPRIRGLETSAKVEISNRTDLCDPAAIYDGKEPEASNRHPGNLCHWWPRKGTKDDWIAYRWPNPMGVSRARVFWFDDTGFGECRLPKSWRLESWVDGKWVGVMLRPRQNYTVKLDSWCEVEFEPQRTQAMRLRFEMLPGYSVGIHEWQVFED